MAVKPVILKRVRCNECFSQMVLDANWKPDPGYDPRLKRYTCTGYKCENEQYRLVSDADRVV